MSLLGTLFEFKEAEPGEVICREGDADREFYLVIEGRLKVTVINDNRVIELSILRENDWFGEISLIFNTTRTATITCESGNSSALVQILRPVGQVWTEAFSAFSNTNHSCD